jgi:hypothetical protein
VQLIFPKFVEVKWNGPNCNCFHTSLSSYILKYSEEIFGQALTSSGKIVLQNNDFISQALSATVEISGSHGDEYKDGCLGP